MKLAPAKHQQTVEQALIFKSVTVITGKGTSFINRGVPMILEKVGEEFCKCDIRVT